jgi:hypothetical protein
MVFALLTLIVVGPALCAEPADLEGPTAVPAERSQAIETNGVSPGPDRRRRVWWLAPPADFYPQYIADPRRPQSALLLIHPLDTEIPESEGGRVGVRLGGRFALFRVHPEGSPDRGWQLDLEAGFSSHFDMENALDNIGWDGFYGLMLSWRPGPDLGFRVGTLHDSAHVGDEYAERTGRRRIGYTREELVAGISWSFRDRWRSYAEIGHAYGDIDDFQARWRLQGGLEYIGRRHFWNNRMPWYAAADITAFEESDWQLTVAAQLGLILPTGRGTSRFRVALEFVDGRSVLGEFFFRDESYLALGLFFDL